MIKVFLLATISGLLGFPAMAHTDSIIQINADTCKKKEIKIGSTPFKIDLFCEDALGKYIGVVYRDVMGAVASGGWSIEDRYWQAKEWSMDVQSLLAIDGGKNLLISTSGIYGHEGVYLLRLSEKKWERIFEPKDKTSEYVLVMKKFDRKTRTLTVQYEGKKKTFEILVGK